MREPTDNDSHVILEWVDLRRTGQITEGRRGEDLLFLALTKKRIQTHPRCSAGLDPTTIATRGGEGGVGGGRESYMMCCRVKALTACNGM